MQNPNNENPIALHPLLKPLAAHCLGMIDQLIKLSLILSLLNEPPISLDDNPPE